MESTPLKLYPRVKHLFKTCSLLYLHPYWPLCSFIADVNALYWYSSDDYLVHIYSEAWFRTSVRPCGIYHGQSGCRTSYFPRPSVSLFSYYATNAPH